MSMIMNYNYRLKHLLQKYTVNRHHINRVIRMNKNFSYQKVWCFYDHMSLSRDRIWHYFSVKPYTEIATATFVLDRVGGYSAITIFRYFKYF